MDDNTLKKVQSTMLDMAKDIVKVCNENNISYFLDGGTMLGAIRHKGFIPWDDDFDIGMFRDDYEKFLKVAQKELGNRYFVQTCETDTEYGFWFAKVRLRNSVYEETAASNNSHYKGFYVDIFPYDHYPDESRDRKSLQIKLEILKKALLAKTRYPIWLKNEGFSYKRYVLYNMARLALLPFNKNSLEVKYRKIATKWNETETIELFPQGNSKSGKFHMEKALFCDKIQVPFEDTYFSVLSNYDVFLSTLYGDYMRLPPEADRGNRHNIKRIVFEEDQK